MRWMPLWETDGIKMMPLFGLIKYSWHYRDAGIEKTLMNRIKATAFIRRGDTA